MSLMFMRPTTIHIQQRSDNDCALASIAMAAGVERWTDIWTTEDLEAVKASKGVSDLSPWLTRAGFKSTDYLSVYHYNISPEALLKLLWARRALVSIASLNQEQGSHLVYWDGFDVWDPQKGIANKQYLRFLSSANIRALTLLLPKQL